MSGGDEKRDSWMSSKPVMATSPGTATLTARADPRPTAIWSLATTMALGKWRLRSSRLAMRAPPASEKSSYNAGRAGRRQSCRPHGPTEPGKPGLAIGRLRRPTGENDVAVTVHRQEVLCHGIAAALVVRGHKVGGRGLPPGGQQYDTGLSSQDHQFWLWDAAGQDHEAVDSSRHGPHHPRAVRASGPGDQHGVAGLVRCPLGPPDHLVGIKKDFVPDLGALVADIREQQADHAMAVRGQPPGRAVGDVPQFLYRGQDQLAVGRRYARLFVQCPRHGRSRHARPPGYLEYRDSLGHRLYL